MSASEQEELERILRPRASNALVGHDAALARAAYALRAGRPPQAWLIAGPPGIGKATFAYRLARYLLRYGATTDGLADLSVNERDPVARQVAAGAHPGLLVLTRMLDEKGRLRTVLRVEEIRRLGGFFGLTSGAGGWRVAIVDSADELNENAANALLKALEEPPPRAILLLLAHAPGRLLPTIRSRCQRLNLRPLDAGDMAKALDVLLPDSTREERQALIEFSEGSPGLALRLSEGNGLELAKEARSLIEAAAAPDFAALYALAERVGRTADSLADFGAFLAQGLARRIRERAARGGESQESWVEAWEKINSLYARTAGIHMEPRQTVIASSAALRSAKRRQVEHQS